MERFFVIQSRPPARNPRSLHPPDATRQVVFHELLLAARNTRLSDALRSTLTHVDPLALAEQLNAYAPRDIRQILAGVGIRDEFVFPTPIVLEARPTLVGYYRLLTGIGQKRFYRSSTGMGPFARLENDSVLSAKTRELLPAFCTAMAAVLSDLIREIAPALTQRDIHELQLLTLG